MDTNIRSVKAGGKGRRYQRRSLELKRRIVEQTLVPGASVARIALEHGINANQVFNWRKLYRESEVVRMNPVLDRALNQLTVTLQVFNRPSGRVSKPSASSLQWHTFGSIRPPKRTFKS